LATSRIEGNRNFATKLWNAARFCQMNECAWWPDFDVSSAKQTVNRWIASEAKSVVEKMATYLEDLRFDLATAAAYEFVWNTFCDSYLEFTKPLLAGQDEAAKKETRATTAWVLVQILHFLHPIMPFITEELWQQFTSSGEMLITAKWPEIKIVSDGAVAQDEMNWLVRLISDIRAIRAELNVPAGAMVSLQIKGASSETKTRLERHHVIIVRMARLSNVSHVEIVPKGSAQAILGEATLILPLAEIIDLDRERARLKKEGERIAAEIKKIEAKLSNQDFVERAPPEVVEEQRERKAEAEATLAKLEAAQKSLTG